MLVSKVFSTFLIFRIIQKLNEYMDPINIIIGLNIIATFGANYTGAKKGVKTKIGSFKEKPKTYLQWLPLAISTLTLILLIISVFQLGTLEYAEEYNIIRYIGLVFYLVFSWIQIWAFKTLGENYAQEIIVFKDHQLITKGPFKLIRHPQYLSQILLDLGAAAATLSFILLPFAIIQIPFLFIRASLEDKLMEKHLGERWESYRQKTGSFLPFVG
jgi:protein-S-isoprenylcysteine O-methyltransferase Ste14